VIDVAVILNPASGSAGREATPERIVELFAAERRAASRESLTGGRLAVYVMHASLRRRCSRRRSSTGSCRWLCR
jgi:hypothetical protein